MAEQQVVAELLRDQLRARNEEVGTWARLWAESNDAQRQQVALRHLEDAKRKRDELEDQLKGRHLCMRPRV